MYLLKQLFTILILILIQIVHIQQIQNRVDKLNFKIEFNYSITDIYKSTRDVSIEK